jgi:ACS family sodium-dependent inorganic phosphate cotransporter
MFVLSLQSIGFVGPGIALIGLTTAKSPSVASAWLTLAVGLKSFSHSGFLVNLQVGICVYTLSQILISN